MEEITEAIFCFTHFIRLLARLCRGLLSPQSFQYLPQFQGHRQLIEVEYIVLASRFALGHRLKIIGLMPPTR